MTDVPKLEKYLLIKDLLARQGDMKGQVILLKAIVNLPGIDDSTAADALLTAGNVLHDSGEAAGAKTVEVNELRERAFDRGIIQAQGNEAALLIKRITKPKRSCLQLRPV
jgi:hypothetical protein